MKKEIRILFSLALFAAFFTACGPESVNNSNNAIKPSTSTPTSASTPAQDDLPAKLKKLGVSDMVKQGETKSNVELLTGKLNDYKENYKRDPSGASTKLNEALNSFGDEDV